MLSPVVSALPRPALPLLLLLLLLLLFASVAAASTAGAAAAPSVAAAARTYSPSTWSPFYSSDAKRRVCLRMPLVVAPASSTAGETVPRVRQGRAQLAKLYLPFFGRVCKRHGDHAISNALTQPARA